MKVSKKGAGSTLDYIGFSDAWDIRLTTRVEPVTRFLSRDNFIQYNQSSKGGSEILAGANMPGMLNTWSQV